MRKRVNSNLTTRHIDTTYLFIREHIEDRFIKSVKRVYSCHHKGIDYGDSIEDKWI
jgi:hypothetical protein